MPQNSPVVPGMLHIYCVALSLNLGCFLCVRNSLEGLESLNAIEVLRSDNQQYPKILYNSILHTHIDRHRRTHKRGRFSHHKPQPFNGRRRRTSSEMNYRDRNICLAHGNFRLLQQLLLQQHQHKTWWSAVEIPTLGFSLVTTTSFC